MDKEESLESPVKKRPVGRPKGSKAKLAKTQKDLDVDQLYRKIMPSSRRTVDDAYPPRAAETPEIPTVHKNASISPSAGAPVNLMEPLVLARLDVVFRKFNCCRCDRCKKDALALALNQLKPHYVVADADKIKKYCEGLNMRQITSAIIHAVLTVRGHPRH